MTLVQPLFLLLLGVSASLAPTGSDHHNSEQTTAVWNIQYGIYSGWGSKFGVRIWSDGRVANCTSSGCKSYDYCDSARVSQTMLYELEEQIRKFPQPEYGDPFTYGPDSCSDESEHKVVAEIDGKRIGFTYSAVRSCRNGEDVPLWMAETVEIMSKHLSWISGCTSEE